MSDLPTRPALVEEMTFARQELLRSLLFLSEREATEILLHGDWCVRDVISHIAARECTVLAAIRHLVEDGHAQFANPLDDRQFNLAAVERRRDLSLEDGIDELDGIRQSLLQHVRSVDGRQLYVQFPVGTGEEVRSVGQALAALAEHDYLHAAGIWRWRVANNMLYRDEFRYLFTTARGDLLNALGGLHEEDMLTEEVCGRWTVQEVMAHTLSWDEEALRTVKHWAEPRPWQEEALYDDEWNESEVSKRANLDVISLADGLATYHRRLVQHFDSLPDQELTAMAKAPWSEQMALISFYLDMADHDRSHAPDLEALQESLRQEWEPA